MDNINYGINSNINVCYFKTSYYVIYYHFFKLFIYIDNNIKILQIIV